MGIVDAYIVDLDTNTVIAVLHIVASYPEEVSEKVRAEMAKRDPPVDIDDLRYHTHVRGVTELPGHVHIPGLPRQ
jgi:hypothetical protein